MASDTISGLGSSDYSVNYAYAKSTTDTPKQETQAKQEDVT